MVQRTYAPQKKKIIINYFRQKNYVVCTRGNHVVTIFSALPYCGGGSRKHTQLFLLRRVGESSNGSRSRSPPAALQALQPAQAQLVPAEPEELRAAREAMRRGGARAADPARLREEELDCEAERGVPAEEQHRGEGPGCHFPSHIWMGERTVLRSFVDSLGVTEQTVLLQRGVCSRRRPSADGGEAPRCKP